MKIAIIGAMEKEITNLLTKLDSYKTTKYKKYVFYEGNLNCKDLIITSSGIGKVASGLLVSALVNYYQDIDLIINLGVSGGILGKVNIGDIVIANKLKYADVDVTIFPKYSYGQIPNCPPYFETSIGIVEKANTNINYKVGTILSGDQFYHNKDTVDKIINRYFKNDNVLCIDMESSALAQASWFYEIDYLAIRAISDIIGNSAQGNEYNDNLDLACTNSSNFILKLLENI